jgi:hypothetical protein
MANTFTLIASSTVGSGGAANITFSSIPATYTDLVLKISARHNGSSVANAFWVTFNGTTSNYSTRYLEGAGSGTPASAANTARQAGVENGNTSTSNTFSNTEIYIPNYAGSTYKSFSSDSVVENNATLGIQWLLAKLWSDNSAINSIAISPDAAVNYLQYSTAYLYGIKKD